MSADTLNVKLLPILGLPVLGLAWFLSYIQLGTECQELPKASGPTLMPSTLFPVKQSKVRALPGQSHLEQPFPPGHTVSMFSWFPLREEQAITEGGHPGSAAQDFCGQGRSDSPSVLPCLFLTAGDCMGKLLCSRGDQKGALWGVQCLSADLVCDRIG